MKKLIKILIVLIIIAAIFFAGAYIYVKNNGKRLLTEQLSRSFKTQVAMDDIRLRLPLTLTINNLTVKDYGYVKKMTVGLSWLQLFKKEVRLPVLIFDQPTLTIERNKNAQVALGPVVLMPEKKDVSQEPAADGHVPKAKKNEISREAGKEIILSFVVDRFIINSGEIHFVDYTQAKPFACVLSDVNLKALRLSYPFRSVKTKFDINATFKKNDGKQQDTLGRLAGFGWANLAKKDMQGTLEVNDLDSRLFSEYYSQQTSVAFSGKLDLTANLHSKNNDMTVTGDLNVKSVALPEAKKDIDSFSIEDYILQGLQSVQAEIATSFQFKTKMDDFRVEKISFSGKIGK